MTIPTDANSDAAEQFSSPEKPEPLPDSYEPKAEGVPVSERVRQIAFLAVLLYAAFDLLLPLIRVPLHRPHSQAQAFLGLAAFLLLPTGVFMLLQVWLSRSLVALRWPPIRAVAVLIISVTLWFATLWMVSHSRQFGPAGHFAVVRLSVALFGLFLTIALTALGTLLARIVREPNVLLPVALVAMPIDYVGAMTSIGFTHTVVSHAPQVVQAVSVPVPHVGGIAPVALIGPGDALFMAFFFAVVQRFGMNMRGTFWWMSALLALAMFFVLLTPFAIAALVPMGIAVIIANRRYFRLKREEAFAVLYAALILFAVIGAFYYLAHRYITHGR